MQTRINQNITTRKFANVEIFSAYANNSFTNADKRKENGEPYKTS